MSNNTLMALDIVRNDFMLPDFVIELQKEAAFHKRVIGAHRYDKYFGEVQTCFRIMRTRGYRGGIEMHDEDVASQYMKNYTQDSDEDEDEASIQWQQLRLEEISEMSRAEKWKVVPFLRASGYWVTIFYDDSTGGCPFDVSDGPPTTQPSAYMSDKCKTLAPLAPGDYDLTPPTVPHRFSAP
jgi:hypothetical protein